MAAPHTSLAQARRRAAEAACALRPAAVQVPVVQAVGLICDAPVEALQPIPHAATSAMDGWAIRGPGPWRIVQADLPDVPGRPQALSPVTPRPALSSAEAVAVVTGSPIPAGATSVLRSEHGHLDRSPARDVQASDEQTSDVPGSDEPTGALLRADPTSGDTAAGQHIRPAGAEAAAGETLLRAGQRITPARAAMAAVAGHDQLRVCPPASVALICTGAEVITSGLPEPGQVRDAFEVSVPGAVGAMGGVMQTVRRVGDDAGSLATALHEAVAAEVGLVLTTGGTARSEADALRPALMELDAEVLIDSVDMRPGHPVVLARAGGTLVLGMPGNPLAGFTSLVALGQVIIDGLRGVREPQFVGLRRGRAEAELTGARRGLRLLPVQLDGDAVSPVGHDNPHMMRGLSSAQALALVPVEGILADEQVQLLPLPWSEPAWGRSTSWDV